MYIGGHFNKAGAMYIYELTEEQRAKVLAHETAVADLKAAEALVETLEKVVSQTRVNMLTALMGA